MSSLREGETIDITRYAVVMAHLRYFPPAQHAEVIARLGIRRRDWDAAAAKWYGVRDVERTSGELEVTIRFGRVMADTRAKLEAKQPPIESLGPLPGPDGEASAEAAVPGRTSAVSLKELEDGSTVPLAVAQVLAALLDPATGDVPSRWGSKAPSYVTAELHSAASPRMAPLRAAAPVPLASPISAPLIVRAGSTSAAPLAGTADLDISAIVAAIQQGALPFAHPPSSPGGVVGAAEKAPVLPRRSPSVGTGTVETNMNALTSAERDALPFARLQTHGPGAAEAEEDFDLSLLPLETYASVSGALARGESREATLKRHGLTVDAFEILAKAWAQRFKREPSLLEKFKDLARSAAAGKGGTGQR